MPWHVARAASCPAEKPFGVIKDADGTVQGCHPSAADAQKQIAALYANEVATIGWRNPELRSEATEAIWNFIEAQRPSARLIDQFYAATRVAGNSFERELRRTLSDLGAHVAAAANSVGGLEVETREAAEPTGKEQRQVEAILGASSLDIWRGRILRKQMEEAYRHTGTAIMQLLERKDIIPSKRDLVMQKLLDEGGRRLGLIDLNASTKQALFNALDFARTEGLNPREIARSIREFVPAGRFVKAGSKYRAELISRTEMLHAQRFSALEAYKASPVVQKVQLYDGDGDEYCIARDGEIMSFEEAEVEMMASHPNCVLAFAPVTS